MGDCRNVVVQVLWRLKQNKKRAEEAAAAAAAAEFA